jgi:hypothetical protein
MRLLFSLIIVGLLTFLAAGVSSAQKMGEPCHDKTLAVENVKKSVCCCSHSMQNSNTATWEDISRESGCSVSKTCRSSLVPEDAVFFTIVSPPFFSGLLLSTLQFQPVTPGARGLYITGLPPPRSPPAPVYIRNCSFLI